MSYVDKAEVTREYYRKQGEERERERIIQQLQRLQDHKPGVAWKASSLANQLRLRGVNLADTTLTKHRTQACACYRR